MSMNTLDAFGPLDDLIQVIYQASHRFVLLSHLDFDAPVPEWQIHLGLADSGRWWKGSWTEEDVDVFVVHAKGKNVSSELLEAFADNISGTVTQGELFVGGIGTETGTEIKIIFGPNGAKPLTISLTELSSQEAAVFITNEFFTLGLNAQKRKCKLNPPAFPVYSSIPVPSAPAVSHEHRQRHSPPPAKRARRASASPPSSPPKVLHSIKAEQKQSSSPRKSVKEKTPIPVEPAAVKPKPKGGLVKKARKVQNMEFASDDE